MVHKYICVKRCVPSLYNIIYLSGVGDMCPKTLVGDKACFLRLLYWKTSVHTRVKRYFNLHQLKLKNFFFIDFIIFKFKHYNKIIRP